MDGRTRAKLAIQDARAFNGVMLAYGVNAGIIIKDQNAVSRNCKFFEESVCIYRIALGPNTRMADVMKYEPEIRAAIAKARNDQSGKMAIRFDTDGLFTLEADAPNQGYMLEYPKSYKHKEFEAPIGVSYSLDGRKPFVYSLEAHHQTLVAAISGHGKSRFLQNVLRGLSISTSPERLQMFLIDCKNDDLATYKDLPHVAMFAWSKDDVAEAIAQVDDIKNERIAIDGYVPEQRILLVIDEAAEIERKQDGTLASIMKLGRSLWINVLLATQYPTAAQVGQKTARAFTHRFVGRMESASSALWATGLADTGAELLRKPGSFLYVIGGDVERLQVYK